MKLDRTVNAGTIIHLIGVVITLVVLYTGVITRLTTLETKVESMWKWFQVKLEQMNSGHRRQ